MKVRARSRAQHSACVPGLQLCQPTICPVVTVRDRNGADAAPLVDDCCCSSSCCLLLVIACCCCYLLMIACCCCLLEIAAAAAVHLVVTMPLLVLFSMHDRLQKIRIH
jgi:hypothetical protein